MSMRGWLAKLLGNRGENAAVRFLRRLGYRIMARNCRNHWGEIDIIARDGDWIVFVEVKTRRTDYQKTCQAWLDRLRDHEGVIKKKWGEQVFVDYDRYLSTCVWAFDKHYQSLAQYSLKRID